MSHQPKSKPWDRVRRAIYLIATYYREQMLPEIVEMYIADLSLHLSEDQVVAAMNAWRGNPRHRKAPLPADLIEMFKPSVDESALAGEIAQRLVGAVAKFGFWRSGEAREFMGPVGWQYVLDRGGWQRLCEDLGVKIPESVFLAQARDALKTRLHCDYATLAQAVSQTLGGRAQIDS